MESVVLDLSGDLLLLEALPLGERYLFLESRLLSSAINAVAEFLMVVEI